MPWDGGGGREKNFVSGEIESARNHFTTTASRSVEHHPLHTQTDDRMTNKQTPAGEAKNMNKRSVRVRAW